MGLELCSIEKVLGVTEPVYLRKLVRKSHWGISSDAIEERLESVAESFKEDGIYSFYFAQSDDDFHRIAVALNGSRGSLLENLDLVAFTPEDLEHCALRPFDSPGKLTCKYANSKHVDITATKEEIALLCRAAMENRRTAGRLSKPKMRLIVDAMKMFGCDVISPEPPCECSNDL